MKKNGILNQELASVVAGLGHGDGLLICDAGMPRPPHVPCVDLSIVAGLPRFLDVVEAVCFEMQIEQYVLADEVKPDKALMFALRSLVQSATETFVTHEDLKEMSNDVVAIVRTGEVTPYANILLVSGVTF